MVKLRAAALIAVLMASPAVAAPRQTIIVQAPPVIVHVDAAKPEAKLAWYADPVWVTADATIALTLVTALLWGFTALMWWEARNARRDTVAALEIARAAYTAEHKPDLKPYVGFETNDTGQLAERLVLMVTNDGASPATIISYDLNLLIQPEGIFENYDLDPKSQLAAKIETGRCVVGHHPIKPSMLNAINTKKTPTGLVGRLMIEYEDGSRRVQNLDFHLAYNIVGRNFVVRDLDNITS